MINLFVLVTDPAFPNKGHCIVNRDTAALFDNFLPESEMANAEQLPKPEMRS